MNGLFGLVGLLFGASEIIKEKTTKPLPKATRFDWDAYYEDIRKGMTTQEQIKKRQRGGYWTTKPLPSERPLDVVDDVERYESDKKIYGESLAEIRRKNGLYRRSGG